MASIKKPPNFLSENRNVGTIVMEVSFVSGLGLTHIQFIKPKTGQSLHIFEIL